MQTDPQRQDLSKLGIDDLMNIEVTTASKQSQTLAHVPAAIYVVTQEDIHRSGATCIPEALRMVPGVQVARINTNQWVVSIRGFDTKFADKLLVMIDGRSIYDPLFSGVFWDAPEVDMADVARIEVIRGPGGTLWGANAVNGIINIITKESRETQGNAVESSGSTTEGNSLRIENGGKIGPKAFYRVYARYFDITSFPSTVTAPGSDNWQGVHAGFRTDWTTSRDAMTFSGGINSSHQGQTSRFPSLDPPYTGLEADRFPISNWDLLGRWERTDGPSKGMSLQVSLDQSVRSQPEGYEKRDKLSVDFQRPLRISSTNSLVWGLGYLVTRDRTMASRVTAFDPASRQDEVFSGFIQDELNLSPHLQLSLGTKVEHNDYSGWELQPSARLTWQRNSKQTVWAAISRAVRTPNRLTSDIIANERVNPPDDNSALPVEVRLYGNPSLKSEVVVAHEIGWRFVPSEKLSLDVTAYYNRYDNLISVEPGTPFFEATPVPHIVQPLTYHNGMNADTAGLEVAGQYQISPVWRLKSALTVFSSHFSFDAGSNGSVSTSPEGPNATPHLQFNINSLVDFSNRLQLDTAFYYVDRNVAQDVPSYGRLDLRLGWRPSDTVECSLGIQNLLTTRHRESGTYFIEVPAYLRRNVSFTATFKF